MIIINLHCFNRYTFYPNFMDFECWMSLSTHTRHLKNQVLYLKKIFNHIFRWFNTYKTQRSTITRSLKTEKTYDY